MPNSAAKPKPFVAIITPISAPAGCPPLQIWGGSGIGDYIDAGLPPIVIVKPPEGPPIYIWGGGNEPFPSLPIVIYPGGRPDPPEGEPQPPLVIWGGGGVGDYIDAGGPGPQPHPEHPIVIPPPPEPFPEAPPEVIKPAPDEGGWGYADPPGTWFFVPPADAVSPKKRR